MGLEERPGQSAPPAPASGFQHRAVPRGDVVHRAVGPDVVRVHPNRVTGGLPSSARRPGEAQRRSGIATGLGPPAAGGRTGQTGDRAGGLHRDADAARTELAPGHQPHVDRRLAERRHEHPAGLAHQRPSRSSRRHPVGLLAIELQSVRAGISHELSARTTRKESGFRGRAIIRPRRIFSSRSSVTRPRSERKTPSRTYSTLLRPRQAGLTAGSTFRRYRSPTAADLTPTGSGTKA
jgi:hypothetical protein